MRNYKVLIGAIALGCCLIGQGCVENTGTGQVTPFEEQELDACLAIIVDQSGSFANAWDDRAYDLFLSLSDHFFTEAMGSETKLVIGQLSGSDQVVLFEGRPADLKQRFRSPEELSQFLKDNSDPSSSRVFNATRKAVDYLNTMSGVSDRTRLLTVILSDMQDSEFAPQRGTSSKEQMMGSLKRYQAHGGGLALYFVAQHERQRWNSILQEAGFQPGHYIIEGELSANPQLPRFD